MEPILTPDQMAVVDAASGPSEVLIERAGWQVAFEARRFLGGSYGRRVVVVAGKGNNGADGRVAARWLRSWGTLVDVVDVDAESLPVADLIVDAAFGTGLRSRWDPPTTDVPVLAVDIASGLDPVTGEDCGGFTAALTVTMGALKPGLLFGSGPTRSGSVLVHAIGLDLGAVDVDTWLWTDRSAIRWISQRDTSAHKWTSAVRVIGGSDGMDGAPSLVAEAALRAGSGMVVVSRPDGRWLGGLPRSAVQRQLGPDWVAETLIDIDRFRCVVIGPGLGRDPALAEQIRSFVAKCPIPIVVDADALHAVATDLRCISGRAAPTILTPHDGEFSVLTEERSGPRVEAARQFAIEHKVVLLLKGPTTVVAGSNGQVAVVSAGDERLATAGTGDVLAGMLAAVLDPADAWSSAATSGHWHGLAGCLTPSFGCVADDVVDKIPLARSNMAGVTR